MFAALHSPAVPVAALAATASAFTPRFQVFGSLVLLDVSGVSRLFGDARELGQVLQSAQPAAQMALAGTATAALMLAMAADGPIVIEPGTEAAALAPLPVDLLVALAEARMGDDRIDNPENTGAEVPALLTSASCSSPRLARMRDNAMSADNAIRESVPRPRYWKPS